MTCRAPKCRSVLGEPRRTPLRLKSVRRSIVLLFSVILCASCGRGKAPELVDATPPPTTSASAPQACDSSPGSVTDVAHEPPWRAYAAYKPWANTEGCLIRIDVLAERPGPEHCGWEAAEVLIVGRPVGEKYTAPDDATEYVRDPAGVFGQPPLVAGFSEHALVPASATDTHFRRGDVALWVDSSDDSSVWIVRDSGDAERWPKGSSPGCA